MPVAEKYSHTTEEIYALPEGKRRTDRWTDL